MFKFKRFLVVKEDLPLLTIKGNERVLFLVPHPDDETLVAGGLLADLFQRKVVLRLVFLTSNQKRDYSSSSK